MQKSGSLPLSCIVAGALMVQGFAPVFAGEVPDLPDRIPIVSIASAYANSAAPSTAVSSYSPAYDAVLGADIDITPAPRSDAIVLGSKR